MKKMLSPTLWNLKCLVLVLLLMPLFQPAAARQQLPVVKATASTVDIRDGAILQKGIWNLSPGIKPDIYYALEPVREKKITFYTDIDSVSFDIIPGNTYNFIILLNGKDSCYTQIATKKPVQSVSLNKIPPGLLQQDFRVFREALQQYHAGLYRYQRKKVLDKLFDSCIAALDHPMPPLEFAQSIMFAISSIKDGHTGSNIPRLLMNYYPDNEKMFPAWVYFIGEKAYVLCCNHKELAAGSEILSIDDNPVAEIREKFFQYLPSDGNIETKKQQTLNNGAFPFLYNWLYGNKQFFFVRYKTRTGVIKTIRPDAEFLKDFQCEPENQPGKPNNLGLEFPSDGIAILSISTFDDNRLGGSQQFREFLEASFSEIKNRKTQKLIIDLRGNGGGRDDYGALLYSWLTNKPFNYFAAIESTTRKISLQENYLLGMQQPQKNNYTGQVFFLVNGLSFSTTADFCAVAKSNNRGKFIGEETGGGYYGNTSGQTTSIELPVSKIKIIIPLFRYTNNVKQSEFNDRGIIPDYPVSPSIDDVILNNDVQLQFALKIADNAGSVK